MVNECGYGSDSRIHPLVYGELDVCMLKRGRGQHQALLRFYGELNDHLPSEARACPAQIRFDVSPTAKSAIEAFGVPHVEVARIDRAGEEMQFSDRISPDDRIAVYPVFRTFEIARAGIGWGGLSHPLRFLADIHLRKLARLLRLLGIDTEIGQTDADLSSESILSRRVLLTRDRQLLMRRELAHGYWVRSTDPIAQVVEVARRFRLAPQMKRLQRCSVCNGVLHPVAKNEVESRLPPKTARWLDRYMQCERCGKLYWRGTHMERINRMLDRVASELSGVGLCNRTNHAKMRNLRDL